MRNLITAMCVKKIRQVVEVVRWLGCIWSGFSAKCQSVSVSCQYVKYANKTTYPLNFNKLNQIEPFWHKICFYIVMKTIN